MNNKEGIDKLIQEVMEEMLNEKFTPKDPPAPATADKSYDKDEWEYAFGSPIHWKDIGYSIQGQDSAKPGDSFALADKEVDKSRLGLKDIKYYIDNPKEINTDIESKLIAIAIVGGNGTAAGFTKRIAAMVAKRDSLASPGVITRWQKKIDYAQANQAPLMALALAAREALKKHQGLIDKAQTDDDGQTVSDPRIATIQGETGKYPKGLSSAVERLLGGMSFEGRMKEVTKISTTFYEAATEGTTSAGYTELQRLGTLEPSKLLTQIQVLDFFNAMVKEFDGGAGAYLFEYFMAVITEGTVAGKELTSTSKMGSTDFLTGKGEAGSAKFYGRGVDIKQSAGGFIDAYNKQAAKGIKEPLVTTYAVGVKKQGSEQLTKVAMDQDEKKKKRFRGGTDPARIFAIEVFAPKVKYDGKFYVAPTGTEDYIEVTPDNKGKIVLDNYLQNPLGVMYVASTRTGTFRQMMDTAIDDKMGTAQAAYKAFKEYFDSLQLASEQAKVYTNNGRPEEGNKVYENLNAAEGKFDNLVGALEYKHTATPTTQGHKKLSKKVSENKQKALDKLIEEVILDYTGG